MRTAILISAGALALAFSATSAHAGKAFPGGSYLSSCSSLNTSGGALHAVCTTRRGHRVRTSLQAYRHCVGDISNRNGRLTCQLDIPSGSYLDSCTRIRSERGNLTATCQTRRGDKRFTELRRAERCMGDIQNLNGTLSCEKPRRGDRYGYDPVYGGQTRPGSSARYTVPAGSYQRSCFNLQRSRGLLTATCRTRSGQVRYTSLDRPGQCVSDIANNNGQLVCRDQRSANSGDGRRGGSPQRR